MRKMPKHRFTDYSKAQINIDYLEKRKYQNGSKNNGELVNLAIAMNSLPKLKDYVRLEYLNPPER